MTASQATGDTPPATLVKAGYRARSRLSTDDLGDVYLAERTDGAHLVALRVLRPEFSANEAVVREVRRRANLAAKLAKDHPNLAAVYECGETDDGRLFVATEHVEGESLAEVLRRDGPLDVGRCLRLAVQIAQGLEFIHNSAGSIHGDLRPENIALATDGEAVKVRGFELAGAWRAVRRDPAYPAVPAGPEYLAPEQIRGEALAEPTDIYTFGLVVYEMLRGAPPFTGSTPAAVAARQLDEVPSGLATRHRDIPHSMERLLLQALEKAPERRPQDMTEVANALWAELSGSEERIAKARRRRLAWKVAGACLVLLTATVAWTLVRQKERPPATIAAPPPAGSPASAVIPPTQYGGPESDAVGDGATETAMSPAAVPSAAPVEPTAPQEVERVPAGAATPEAMPEHDGRRMRSALPAQLVPAALPPPPVASVPPSVSAGTPIGPSGEDSSKPASQDGTSGDSTVRRSSVRAPATSSGGDVPSDPGRNRPFAETRSQGPASSRTPSAPDPGEVIDWLLRESSPAR
ncbi:MAG: protein kinase domain-containing protein [Candidatus Rokuibacteriota bacterium]